MTYAAITGWGKCMPPAVLSNQDLATFLDTTDDWIISRTGMKERGCSHVGDRHGDSRQRPGARVRGSRRGGPRPDRLRQLQRRRAGPQQRFRSPVQARRPQCGVDGCQHGLHQLPVRAVECERDDPYGCRAQCAGDRRRTDFALHGLDQSQRGGPVRRRLRGRCAAGERNDEGGTARRTAWLLRRCAPDPARARHGLHLREPRRAVRRHPVGLRRTGDLQEGGQRHGTRIAKGPGEVRRHT